MGGAGSTSRQRATAHAGSTGTSPTSVIESRHPSKQTGWPSRARRRLVRSELRERVGPPLVRDAWRCNSGPPPGGPGSVVWRTGEEVAHRSERLEYHRPGMSPPFFRRLRSRPITSIARLSSSTMSSTMARTSIGSGWPHRHDFQQQPHLLIQEHHGSGQSHLAGQTRRRAAEQSDHGHDQHPSARGTALGERNLTPHPIATVASGGARANATKGLSLLTRDGTNVH